MHRICVALVCGLILLGFATQASSLSVEWKNLDARERVTIRLDANEGKPLGVVRSGEQTVSLTFSLGGKEFSMSSPKSAKLFKAVQPSPQGLDISLKHSAFGFIVTKPSKNILHVDFYHDPLGKEWKLESARAKGSSNAASTPAAESGLGAPAKVPAKTADVQDKTTAEAVKTGDADAKAAPQNSTGATVQTGAESNAPEATTGVNSATGSVVVDKNAQAGSAAGQGVGVEQSAATEGDKQGETLGTPEKLGEQQTLSIENLPAPREPSSVFSEKISPPQNSQPVSSPDAEQPALTDIPEGRKIERPAEDADNYKLPAWPPLEMPDKLPAPPLPPASSGVSFTVKPFSDAAKVGYDNAAEAGSYAWDSYKNSAKPGTTDQLNGSAENAYGTRSFNWRDLLPFASVAHAASPELSEYESVEAPFAYRAKLNVSNDPGWAEQPVPVMVLVPKGSAIADSAKRAANAAQPITQGGQATQSEASSSSPQASAPAGSGAAASRETGTAQTAGNVLDAAPASEPLQTEKTDGQTPAPSVEAGAQVPAQPDRQTAPSAPNNGVTAPSATEPVAGAAGTSENLSNQTPATQPTPAGSNVPSVSSQGGGAGEAPSAQPATPATQAGAREDARPEPQRVPSPPESTQSKPTGPVIYVDEEGNPVEAPLDPEETLQTVERHMTNGEYDAVVTLLDKLLKQFNLNNKQREIALHRKADAMFSLYESDLGAHYQAISDSSTAAINFNTRSPRNAAVYLHLGYVSLKAGNAYEAAGYFNVLRREYKNYENLPLSYYYWGDYQYNEGNLNEAVEQFNYVVNNYPEHPISRDASLALARSYYRMGEFESSLKIMLFVEQRWPTFYLDYPPMLTLLGDAAYRVGELDKARSSYWLYYNLMPEAEDNDMILTRLGDIYSASKYHSAAVQVYSEVIKRFPSTDGGIISMMRLAEDGIYDDPELGDMVKVFARPYDNRPAEAYRAIIREYPDNPLATLAKLKLAMWTLWQNDYVTVLDLTSEIVSESPNSPLAERAREVAMHAFTMMAAADAKDQRYNRAREMWERYPILQTQSELLDPESRLALAVSQWNTGHNSEAMRTLEPFFFGVKMGDISEQALFLALNIMSEHFQWEDIVELAQRVELWELSPQAQNQLDYALGLSYENLDKPESAAPLWANIYAAKILPQTQMANAAFYLARSAERRRELETAYHVGQDALKMLEAIRQADPAKGDVEKIKTQLISLVDIAESSGALQEALNYAQKYLEYVSEGSLDQQSLIFRIARIHKKRGDTADWLSILEDIAEKYPDSVFGKTAKSELASHRLGSEAARFSNTQF